MDVAYLVVQSASRRGCVGISGLLASFGAGVLTRQLDGLSVGGIGVVDLAVSYDQDPFVNFSASTTNLVAGPVTYAFLFGTPIVPGTYNTASSTLTATVTDGPQGGGSVTTPGVHPTYLSGYGTVGMTATNLGVDLGTATCLAGQTCKYGTATTTFGPTFYDNLEALLTYQQSGQGSMAAFSGDVTLAYVPPLTAVPEPATVALLGTGLLVAGLGARRRPRRS